MKFLFFLLPFGLFAQTDTTDTINADDLFFSEDLVRLAQKQLHIPYRYGGTTQKGFDCSGFVRFCFESLGAVLPHSSASMHTLGKTVDVADARVGDLIFFQGSRSKPGLVGHVGIITEAKAGMVKFIHAAHKGGVRFDWLHQEAYYSRRFIGIRRVIGMIH